MIPAPPPELALAGGWWESIEALYAKPKRAYHHAGHVREVLEHWSWVENQSLWSARGQSYVAVLLHDAVYVPGASDNEARSADLVASWCETHGCAVHVGKVEGLIHLTAAHGHHDRASLDRDARLFLDCDMAILAAPPERFDRYEEEVRREYAGLISPSAFDAGRRAFLKGLLTQRIFLSEPFFEAFEARARANLSRVLPRYANVDSSN